MIGCSFIDDFWRLALMVIRRGALMLVCVAALASPTLFAQKEQKEQPRKLNDAQKKEYTSDQKLADDAMAGKPAPNDLGVTWTREDFLKAQNNKEYIPFTVTVDRSKVSGGNLSIYWRVVSKGGAAAAAPAADAKKDDKNKDTKKAEYPYEDYGPVQLSSGNGPAKISRAFSAEAGQYDVYVIVREPQSDKKGAPPAKTSLITQSVTVPDFWGSDLTTSSVIVAERIDPLPAPLSNQQLIERPYAALGTIEVVPSVDMKRTKSGELSTFMLIYNAKTDSANKPDIQVEYSFYTKGSGGEKFFNKTAPQALNAQTLPPQFDLAAGHQLQTGQAVPLASFPEGDYRLEIKVTDKIANKSVTRDVNFSVAGS
jgi:hypothetical protein